VQNVRAILPGSGVGLLNGRHSCLFKAMEDRGGGSPKNKIRKNRQKGVRMDHEEDGNSNVLAGLSSKNQTSCLA
jgi:hypothetical protein